MSKIIRIFLGAYVNFPNAQNINCDNIARYLDKERFEVHVMYSDKLPIDKKKYKKAGVHLHRLIHHRFVWYWCKLLTMLFCNCDIYYLPKMEQADRHIAKLLRRRKVFVSSIEGVITESTNCDAQFRRYHTETMNDCFSISQCIAESVKTRWGLEIPVIPLGVTPISEASPGNDRISSVIWVGNIKANKRPRWLLECAKAFPKLKFQMLGDGDMMDEIRREIKEDDIHNVELFGRVQNEEVYRHLRMNHLLLMTSEYEGLPKVIQEAAICRLPSIYIAENYTVDFIRSGVNGFAVSGLDEMKEKLQYLIDHPMEYQKMSEAAEHSIQPYLWPRLIQQYEDYFTSLAGGKV